MAITAKCQHKCSGKHECICNGLVPHQHHICRDAGCSCHAPAADGLVKAVRRDGSEVYESAPRELRMQP
jgi:hypothetical protein